MNVLDYFGPPAAPTPIMKMANVCVLLGRCRQTVYRWVNEGELPPPLRTPSGRVIGWNRDEVMMYLSNQS